MRWTGVGLSPKGACGDVSRNVTGCPLAGLAADEVAGCFAAGVGDRGPVNGKPGVLQPAAKIQSLDHRLSLVVLLSGDQ